MFNAKVDIARIFVKTENIEKNVDKVSSDIKELNNKTDQKIDVLKEKSNEQDMKIKENEIKLEYLKHK
jgi:outer membrane murein-binding lipoprotein Lpp